MPKVFLDCDGVLADFDGGAALAFGMSSTKFVRRFGLKRFWSKLASLDDFFGALPPLPHARELYEAMRHLKPIIVTGLPRGNSAEPQKRRWAKQHFPDVPVITTSAALKREHCRPVDVLVDDRKKYCHLWEQAGGVLIHHLDAASSIQKLRERAFL